MKTFILKWNPAISNVKEYVFTDILEGRYPKFNWSIWEYEKVEVGDRFYMVRVGEGETGIVMSGNLTTKPTPGRDWSGKGRKTYYSDLDIEYISSDGKAIVSTEKLMELFPGFDWTRGHSGTVLPQDIADRLEVYWKKILTNVAVPNVLVGW